MRTLYIILFLFVNFSTYSQDTVVFQIGNFRESLSIDKNISSDSYSYYTCDSTNHIEVYIPGLNPVIDTLYEVTGGMFTRYTNDSIFHVTSVLKRSNERIIISLSLTSNNPIQYSIIYDVIQSNNREYGLQASKMSKIEFEDLLNNFFKEYDSGFIKIYGINLYSNNKLIGGIGFGEIGLLLFK
ncbi:MAG: hypothetical protein ACJA1C_002003 [Crocinitomicaceae bacterium]|jgi:hypothetical protein